MCPVRKTIDWFLFYIISIVQKRPGVLRCPNCRWGLHHRWEINILYPKFNVWVFVYINFWLCYHPEISFPEGFVLRCVWFFFFLFIYLFFLMFVGTLSLKRLDGSQPNFHTRWMGGLARTLLKMGVIAWAVWQPSWKTLFSRNYDCSSSTHCSGVAFTSAQP